MAAFLFYKKKVSVMIIKCDRYKCSYNVEGICERKKVVLRKRRCISYTIKDSFTIKDLISAPTGFHREKRKYKNNQGKIYK